MRFSDDFLLGAASSATQVEGGDKNNTWYRWCLEGKISDGTSCIIAADHWNRYEEDFSLMAEMGLKCYRIGLEWSRIQPSEGEFSEKAIAHYRKMITSLIDKGIRPLVTLFHFSLPNWLAEMGGFENEKAAEYFDYYAAFVVTNLGDLVNEYITINEPNVYVAHGYFLGVWPPGKRNFFTALKVYKNLAKAHFRAYMTIHDARIKMIRDMEELKQTLVGGGDGDYGYDGGDRDYGDGGGDGRQVDGQQVDGLFNIDKTTKVGVAHHVQVFEPHNPKNPFDIIATKAMRMLFQRAIMDSMTSGWLKFPIGFGNPLKVEMPSDFIGVNYYTRSAVKAKGFETTTFKDAPVNDLNWEVYPRGLGEICRELYSRYGLPIWITENGTSDGDDTFRARFIKEHLTEVANCHAEGIPIERYYHWSLTDNFEWLEGESSRFGLIHIDYDTMERAIKKSGRYYSEIARSHKIDHELDDQLGIGQQQYLQSF